MSGEARGRGGFGRGRGGPRGRRGPRRGANRDSEKEWCVNRPWKSISYSVIAGNQ
jgi:hypothetical protein